MAKHLKIERKIDNCWQCPHLCLCYDTDPDTAYPPTVSPEIPSWCHLPNHEEVSEKSFFIAM